MTRFTDSILQRGELIRRSLKLSKKNKDKNCNKELVTVSEGSKEEKEVVKEDEEAEVVEEVKEEVEEAYTLPELPHTPLSGTLALQRD